MATSSYFLFSVFQIWAGIPVAITAIWSVNYIFFKEKYIFSVDRKPLKSFIVRAPESQNIELLKDLQ